MLNHFSTIAAIATAPGKGGVGIVRVSGPQTATIAQAILGELPKPRSARFQVFRDVDDEAIDEGIALYFPAPNSFTGEDVLELQGHGGPIVMDRLLARCIALGAELARPGEFSERAFLNDKLDLAQAEAIADLIESGSIQAARSAMRSLQGVFSKQVQDLVDALIRQRVYIEAALDFPEEEIDFLAMPEVTQGIEALLERLDTVFAKAQQGRLLREGLQVVIVGQPNAGKSSLLNRLAGQETAIVTAVPGTTRDVLREYIQLDGLPLHVVDTAGLRQSQDPVEQEGIRRAWAEVEVADVLLLLVDAQQGMTAEDYAILEQFPQTLPVIHVFNKSDLLPCPAVSAKDELYISAKTGAGIERLVTRLKSVVGYQTVAEDSFIARRRHLQALERAHQHIVQAKAQLIHSQAGELVAEELRLAQQALGEITGKFTPDDLLGEIFSSFCIGK